MADVGVTPLWNWARQNANMRNEYVKCTLAEFFGTFLVCLLIVGGTTQAGLPSGGYYSLPAFPQLLGYFLAITIFGGVSGAHVNPAVTLGFAVAGKLSWVKVPLYVGAQFLGGYLGAGLAYALYVDLIGKVCGSGPGYSVPECLDREGIHSAMFAPLPQDRVGIPLLDQVVGTTILMMAILAAVDKRNMKIPQYLYGIVVALAYTAITAGLGINAGGVLNPARDLSARLMAVSIGFESETTFGGGNMEHYWLAPFFGPFIGAGLGAVIYVFLVAAQLEDGDRADGDEERGVRRPKSSTPAPQQQQQQQPPPNWRNSGMSHAIPPPPPVQQQQLYPAQGGGRGQGQYYY